MSKKDDFTFTEEELEQLENFFKEDMKGSKSDPNKLYKKYYNVIVKLLKLMVHKYPEIAKNIENNYSISMDELLKRYADKFAPIVTESLFNSAYLPMLNGTASNEFMQISTKGITPDQFTKKAIISTKNGHKFSIENFDKLQGILGTPSRKLLDTAILYLTDKNYYRGNPNTISPTVEIPLKEYGEACGYSLTPNTMNTPEEQTAENKRVQERLKELRKNIRRDLHDLSSVLWTGEETKGKNKGSYAEMRIISSHSINNGIIRINFDVDAARYFVNSYVMQYPTVLLKLDNHKPNAYSIGRKIAFHNSLDHNNKTGTENTLSVSSLLAAAPDIQTIEELKAKKQRNWKDKIKKLLEAALDELVKVELLTKWEYRDPKTSKRYNPTKAMSLEWEQYSKLMVDFTLKNPPDQTARRASKEEATAAAIDAEAPKKKRGRPKKQAQATN